MNKNELTPKEKASKSRIRKLSRMCVLCYKNCVRLHNDSILLYKNGSYPTAYAISIIALEEMGKYITLSNGLFYGSFSIDVDEAFISEVLSDTYNHRSKQRIFLNYDWSDSFSRDLFLLKKKNLDHNKIRAEVTDNFEEKLKDKKWRKYFPNTKKLVDRINLLEHEKHKSLYVGFPKKGRYPDFDKRIMTPFKVNRKKVEGQITLLNDYLLSDGLGVLKGFSSLDFEELEDMITSKYVSSLHRSWPLITKKNRSKFLKWMKLPNDK